MILSKGNLQAIEIIKKDKSTPILNNLMIMKNGGTVVVSRNAMIAVSPVNGVIKKSLPIKETEIKGDILVNEETIREVIKNLPKDSLFEGRLEHCDVDESVKVTMHDGVRERSIQGKKVGYERFVPFKKIFRRVFGSVGTVRVIANLSRMRLLLEAVDKISADGSGELPAFMEFSQSGEITFKTENPRTGQRVVGIMFAYKDAGDKWLASGEFEKSLQSEGGCKIKIKK